MQNDWVRRKLVDPDVRLRTVRVITSCGEPVLGLDRTMTGREQTQNEDARKEQDSIGDHRNTSAKDGTAAQGYDPY